MTAEVQCTVCRRGFVPELALHIASSANGTRYYCSKGCRDGAATPAPAQVPDGALSVAVLNQKGGTGKTTTSVSLAAGLAEAGHRTLLVDLDPQGSVGVSLGAKSPRGIQDVVLQGTPISVCASNVRPNLDVITADAGLAQAEIHLARREGERHGVLAEAMSQDLGYRFVLFDCAPAMSILNKNALYKAGSVLIPVSCDYLSLVGVRQVLTTLRLLKEETQRAITVAGILPTFYDVRNNVSDDVLVYLQRNFGSRLMPPIRVNVRLAEAPHQKKTIFEHAPGSHGAEDYARAAAWLVERLTEPSAARAA